MRAGPDEGDTADAIRACADVLFKDFMVLGCDSITSIPISDILERHRYCDLSPFLMRALRTAVVCAVSTQDRLCVAARYIAHSSTVWQVWV